MSSSISLRHDSAGLVAAAIEGEVAARTAIYRKYAPEVARVIASVMGPDSEIGDLLQEVFVEAFRHMKKLRDAEAVGPWLRQIAVHRVRHCIRRRRRLRLLVSLDVVDFVEPEAPSASPEVREALAETYRLVESLPVDLRVAFALRHLEGLELVDVAAACGVSLATIKRRLSAADNKFRRLAEGSDKVRDWLPRRDEDERA